MAVKHPLVINSTTGAPEELQAGDSLPSDAAVLPFYKEDGTRDDIDLAETGLPFFLEDGSQDDIETFAPTLTDGDAVHDNVAGEIAAIANKTTPVGADLLLIEDSEASNAKKYILVSALPAPASIVSAHYVSSTADKTLPAGDNDVASFGAITIPTKGFITLRLTGRLNNSGSFGTSMSWGIKIGSTYYYPKFNKNGTVHEGYGDASTNNMSMDGSQYLIVYGTHSGTAGAEPPAIIDLDIEALGIPTGSQTVGFAISSSGSDGTLTLQGATVTSRCYMTIQDFS